MKDASAYNIQFIKGRPVLIDTLSFERYQPYPWIAYRQYCEHFLIPLTLAAYIDPSLIRLLQIHLDGIPISLGSRLLKRKLWSSLSLTMHIHWHARSQHAISPLAGHPSIKSRQMSLETLKNLILDLRHATEKLEFKRPKTLWEGYYLDNNYSDRAMASKSRIIEEYIALVKPNMIWDLGANDGTFSRIAAKQTNMVVAWDYDQNTVEANYLQAKTSQTNILPLVLDLANPSPALGWNHTERASMSERGPVDLVLSLALIHHLSITNHLSFDQISSFFADICRYLIVEFVPETDTQIMGMLSTRDRLSHEYNMDAFQQAFFRRFALIRNDDIVDSVRSLYFLRRHE